MRYDIADKLSKYHLILTPTRRLAARLRKEINSHLAEEHRAWVTWEIYAINDWLALQWQHAEMNGYIRRQLLTPTQAILKLETIIQNSEQGKILLRHHETAKSAYEAYKILHQWRLYDQLDAMLENYDQETFKTWVKAYDQWLDDNQAVDDAQLIDHILEPILHRCTQALTVALYAFEEIHPQLQHFFQCLQREHWNIEHIDPTEMIPNEIKRYTFNTQDQEWLACAQWANALLQKSEISIAVVVPNLPDVRNKIERLFHDVIDPLWAMNASSEVSPYINLSAGKPLLHYPIIRDAFIFFKCVGAAISRENVAAILQSPFYSSSLTEADSRAKILSQLKKKKQLNFSLKECIALGPSQETVWQQILTACQAIPVDFPPLPLSDWIPTFRKILQIFGWPGDRSLSSIEHQVVKRFELFLDEVALYDDCLPLQSFYDAWLTLFKLVSHLPFQPENKIAPIQILGILEASGQQFDHLWVMGLHAEAWPPIAKPNPFIAASMQRVHQMPHSGPQRELAYAQLVTARFKTSANEIIFSYPLQEKEKQLLPSALIQDLPLVQLAHQADNHISKAENYFDAKIDLEHIVDEMAPALSKAHHPSSGVATLAFQNECPFKAFAQIRLKADLQTWQDVWFEPLQKGIIIHRVLEMFWRKVQSLQNLRQMSQTAISEVLIEIVHGVVDKYCVKDAPLPYIEVEKTRLQILLLDYIELEKQRQGFTVIATETEKTFSIANLILTVRLDRLDKDNEDRLYIVDYKTGNFKLTGLWDDRLPNVQLPLYFMAMKAEKPSAMFATKLDLKSCSFEGIANSELNIPGIKTVEQWDELQQQWEHKLTALAFDFEKGHAAVDPLAGSATCQYCHLGPLCRIREKRVNLNEHS